MRSFITNFINDESGASAAEYALILVIVGLGIVVAGTALGDAVEGSMNKAANCIDSTKGEGCPTPQG